MSPASTLLSRDAWREAVFARDEHKCVVCAEPAVDAHHIVERKLWPDGGYYLENGVSLCASDHLKAERTEISCEELREQASIETTLLPPQFTTDDVIDKWGNHLGKDGRRYPGEMFYDEQVQKVLRESGRVSEFVTRFKHPRTPHLPWSPGATSDDIEIADLTSFINHEVVVSEKLDGEATVLGVDKNGPYTHARSIDSGYHPSRTWMRQLAAKIAYELPSGWRVSGENVFAKHAIQYSALPSYFFVYAISDESNTYLSYDETVEWCALFGLSLVPELYRGIWNEEQIRDCWSGQSKVGGQQEGYVVRRSDGISYRDYNKMVAKYVRDGHVLEGSEHWAHEEMVINKLAQ